jgi:hypothetical protein
MTKSLTISIMFSGRIAFDIIRHLSGEAIAGLPLVHPSILKPGQQLDMYTAMLRYLLSRGCLLADVAPELLLPLADYREWRLKYYREMMQVWLR